jgi:hypothetical protein
MSTLGKPEWCKEVTRSYLNLGIKTAFSYTFDIKWK